MGHSSSIQGKNKAEVDESSIMIAETLIAELFLLDFIEFVR